ncbi:MAG: TnpV protein, partial [Clostridia bacterium]|nr:TnpV protein [Clostridia bacterium]
MELTYTDQNGLLIPDLVLDDQPSGSLGKYGRMRKRCLEQKHDGTFSVLVLSGKLTQHLTEIDQAARDQLAALIPQLAANQG